MELNDVAVERWVKGDDGAFRDIFSAACHEVYWLAMRVLQNDAAAEDVVQETFLRIHRMRPRIDPARPLRPLLLRIAANCAIDTLRALNRGKEEPMEEEPEDRGDPGISWVDRSTGQEDRQERLRRTLAALPAGYRAVLVLKYAHDMSYSDIAAALDLTVSAVGLRLKRGKELLRQRLTARETRE